MNIRKIIGSLVILFSLVGCFENNGNYTYTRLPKIKVSTTSSATLVIGEKCTFVAKAEHGPEYTGELAFEWMIDGEVVGNEKEYTFEANKIGQYQGLLRAYDVKTGLSYTYQYLVNVKPDYETGFLILSETEDGNSEIHLIRSAETPGAWYEEGINDTLEYKQEYLNLFQTLNGEKLEGKPIGLSEHFARSDNDGELCGEVTIEVDKNGAHNYVSLHGKTLEKETYIAQEFTLSGLPDLFRPTKLIQTCWDSFLLDESGVIYPRRMDKCEAYHVGRFDRDVMLYGGKKFTTIFETYYPKSEMLFAIENSMVNGKLQKNYIGIYSNDYSSDNNQLRVPFANDSNPELLEDFVDLQDEVICSDYYKARYDDSGQQIVILKNSEGEYILHYFEVTTSRRSVIPKKSVKINLTQAFGMTNVVDMATFKNREANFAYVCSENLILWFNNLDCTMGILGTVDSNKIVAMALQGQRAIEKDNSGGKACENDIALCYEDGSVEIFQFEHNYFKYLGNLVYQNKANFGKIKDIKYKAGQSTIFYNF